MSDRVQIVKLVKVMFLKETPEVNTSLRGWAEGAPVWVDVARNPDQDALELTIGNDVYLVSDEVIEALYNLHQDIPS